MASLASKFLSKFAMWLKLNFSSHTATLYCFRQKVAVSDFYCHSLVLSFPIFVHINMICQGSIFNFFFDCSSTTDYIHSCIFTLQKSMQTSNTVVSPLCIYLYVLKHSFTAREYKRSPVIKNKKKHDAVQPLLRRNSSNS